LPWLLGCHDLKRDKVRGHIAQEANLSTYFAIFSSQLQALKGPQNCQFLTQVITALKQEIKLKNEMLQKAQVRFYLMMRELLA
jgi:hypothetical protein